MRRVSILLLAAVLLCSMFAGCGASGNADGLVPAPPVVSTVPVPGVPSDADGASPAVSTAPGTGTVPDIPDGADIPAPGEDDADIPEGLPEYGEYYYDLENVVLYLDLYGELPDNYITKAEARELGWSGGSPEEYLAGSAIGGDRFGNREGLLPEAEGRTYTECDIDTLGYGSRGSRRLVFSSDGLYFYTSDHYASFTEVTVTDGYEVIY